MKKYIILFICCLFIVACSSEKAKQYEEDYQEVESAMKTIVEKLDNPSSLETDSLVRQLVEEDEKLSFEFDESEASNDCIEKYKKLHDDIESIHARVKNYIIENAENIKIIKAHESQKLIKSSCVYPVYLQSDETMFVNVDFENAGSVYIYNAETHKLQKSVKKSTEIHESFTARFGAIYLVQIETNSDSYAKIDIYVKSNNSESILHPKKITSKKENVEKGSFMAQEIEAIKMKNIFEEPRKLTLRGALKAMFSGSSRALVAIQVPKGAKDILYSLRISTNETPTSNDGNFKKDLDISYHKIKFLGMPIYESNRSIGILNTILGENVPPRDEDAYTNMYVFYLAAQARKFQNGAPASSLKYNLDYSTIGTQSCNGRIPTKGYETVYLGFENERVRYNNYVWLEAVASILATEYVRTSYSIDDEQNDEEQDYEE